MWRARRPAARLDEHQAELRLRSVERGAEVFVIPEVIRFPGPGEARLRLGAYPPLMDAHVGHRAFQQLPFVTLRGDAETMRELSRHAACLWRDPRTGACFIQLGWPGPGEPIRPRQQARVLHLGRPQDATSRPLQLLSRDVVRLTSSIEFVFWETAPVEDRPTPERRKVEAFEGFRLLED